MITDVRTRHVLRRRRSSLPNRKLTLTLQDSLNWVQFKYGGYDDDTPCFHVLFSLDGSLITTLCGYTTYGEVASYDPPGESFNPWDLCSHCSNAVAANLCRK